MSGDHRGLADHRHPDAWTFRPDAELASPALADMAATGKGAAGRAPAPRPDFLIIGAQKSASTFLHYCLAQHPDVYVRPGETPIFENPDFSAYHPGFFAAMFRGRTERCLGIRRPNYMGRSEAAPRIGEILPDAKLIAVLRNPVDRAVSAAHHQMVESFIPLMNIEECMRQALAGELQRRYPRAWQILEFGLYYKSLRLYQSFLDRGRLLVIDQTRFLNDKEAVLGEVFAFLGVDAGFVPADLASRKQPGHYHPVSQRLARLANAISHRRDDDNLRAHPRGLPARIVGRGVKQAANIVEAALAAGRRPELGAGCRAELYAYYRDDIENLERLLGWDCSVWKPGGEALRPEAA